MSETALKVCCRCGSRYEQVTQPRVTKRNDEGGAWGWCPSCVAKRDEADHVALMSRRFFTALNTLDPPPLFAPDEQPRHWLRADPSLWGSHLKGQSLAACARRCAAQLLRYAELREQVEVIQAEADERIESVWGDRKTPSREVLNAIGVILKRDAAPVLLLTRLEEEERAA